MNQYAFTHNNPTSLEDPDGHETLFSSEKAEQDFGERFDRILKFGERALHHPAVQAFLMVGTFGAGGAEEGAVEGAAAGAAKGTEEGATAGAARGTTGGAAGETASVSTGSAAPKGAVGAGVATKGKGLTTPSKFFGSKTAPEANKALENKFGSAKSSRPGADTHYNPASKRSYNVHTDPAHGKPHVDIRTTGNVPDRKVPLKEK